MVRYFYVWGKRKEKKYTYIYRLQISLATQSSLSLQGWGGFSSANRGLDITFTNYSAEYNFFKRAFCHVFSQCVINKRLQNSKYGFASCHLCLFFFFTYLRTGTKKIPDGVRFNGVMSTVLTSHVRWPRPEISNQGKVYLTLTAFHFYFSSFNSCGACNN